MTIRLLGMSDEDRLAFEQATGIRTETAQIIIEQAVEESSRLMNTALREIQEVIGPHGAVTRLQAGGVNISRGAGIGVFADGVLKTTIAADGNLFVGSNIDDPAYTSMCVFVNEQVYNNETMGAGDLLVGNNSAANMFYDASEGKLKFRYGSTVNAYLDTNGTITFGGGDGWLDQYGLTFANQEGFVQFLDTTGGGTMKMYADGDNWLVLVNQYDGKGISFLVDNASNVQKQIDFDASGIVLFNGSVDLLDTTQSYKVGGQPIEKGWIPKAETWTRTGNHTFTVATDLTAIYRKGAKVRYGDGGTDYGVIGSSSYSNPTTTINLIPNTDYLMAAATITDTYLSYIENPEGFPQWFNYTTTPTRATTPYTNVPTINLAKWRAAGGILWYEIQSTMHATPGGTGNQQYTAPVTNLNRATGNGMNLNTAYGLVVFVEVASPAIRVFKFDGTQEAIASNIYFINGCYEF